MKKTLLSNEKRCQVKYYATNKMKETLNLMIIFLNDHLSSPIQHLIAI